MRLGRRLVEEIRARGPLSFAEYMEAALYHPEEGFFARAPVGREFVTSPHVSPVFGALLARQVREVREILAGGRTVVDVGAGDGSLGRQLVAAEPEIRYVAVERSAGARAALERAGVTARASLRDLEPFDGCVIANELLDNLPFHLMRARDGAVHEVFVGTDGDRLVEVEGPPTVAPPRLADGEERPIAPGIPGFVAEVAEAIARGYAFVIDYGFTAGEEPEPVRGYRAHRLAGDLLADPGSTDITGPVDFDAVARAATDAGLEVWGPVTQRKALLALGYREMLDALRAQQRGDEDAGDWRAAIKAFGARGEASMLVDPSGLGVLRVLALGTRGLPEPRITRGGAR